MKVPLCIRQGSKRNYDSVSVEELNWSAESQVLIPAEHLWCDFKCRPWAKNASLNTCRYIWVQSFHILQNCCNRVGNKICTYINCFHLCCHSMEVPFYLLKIQIKLRWALFVTYTIIHSIMRSEMCSLHLTHPSGAVGSRHCGARGAVQQGVQCLAQGSHLSRGHFLQELVFEPTTLGYLGFQVQRSIH